MNGGRKRRSLQHLSVKRVALQIRQILQSHNHPSFRPQGADLLQNCQITVSNINMCATSSNMFTDPFMMPTASQHALYSLPTTPHPFYQIQPIASSSLGSVPFVLRTSASYQQGIRFNTPNQTKLQQQPLVRQHHLLTYPPSFSPHHYIPQLTPPTSLPQPIPFPHPSFIDPLTPFAHPMYYHAQPHQFQPHAATQFQGSSQQPKSD